MSKLGDLTGSNKQDVKAINKALDNLIGNGSYTTVDLVKIPLNEICPRYKNYFIDDVKAFKALRSDIKENQLQQPIVVVNIEEYLSKEDVDKDEKEYLLHFHNKGVKYFISSGHRRYKAFVSLYLGNPNIKDFSELYENFNALKFDDKYSEITCNILKYYDKENNIYNGTNLTSRAITNFEYVISYFVENKPENIERGYLNKIHDFIYEKYGNSIGISTISDYVKIFTTFSKELLDCIFSGELALRQALKLISVYDKAIEDPELINKIKNGTFKADDYKPKKKKSKNITFTKSQVYEMLNQIKRDPKILDEMIEKLKN